MKKSLRIIATLLMAISLYSKEVFNHAEKSEKPAHKKSEKVKSIHTKKAGKQVQKGKGSVKKAKKRESSKEEKTKKYRVAPDAVEHDKIAVTIYPPDGVPTILTKKDLLRSSIHGAPQTRDDIIFKHIFFDVATNVMKMDASVERAEKRVEEIMQRYNLSRDHLKNMFQKAGYTYKQALNEIMKDIAAEHLIGYKVSSRIVINDQDIEKYYREHPEYISARYTIRVGLIDADSITDEQVDQWDSLKNLFQPIEWSDEVVLNDEDIADERAYIRNLPVDGLSQIEKTEHGYEVIKLVKKEEKRLKTLEDSSFDIAIKLRHQLFEVYLAAYKQELMENYVIVYHD